MSTSSGSDDEVTPGPNKPTSAAAASKKRPPMKIHHMFTEIPYAIALSKSCSNVFCAFCSEEASTKCPNGCGLAVYCNKSCFEKDQPYHGPECVAIRNGKHLPTRPELTDIRIRLLGRILARYKIDRGIAKLSSDFPTHFAKERCFDELESHSDQFAHDQAKQQAFKEVEVAFRRFFKSTMLESVPDELFRESYNRVLINSLLLTNTAPGSNCQLAEAIYLNFSRFDHNCRPSCLYRFDGARMEVSFIDYDGTKKSPVSFTQEEFDNLTVDYGCDPAFNFGCSCAMNDQRHRALKDRYLFECQCSICTDQRETRIEMDASTIECRKCSLPYVWTESADGLRLEKICQCSEDSSKRSKRFGQQMLNRAQDLRKQWPTIMEKLQGVLSEPDKAREIIRTSSSLFDIGLKIWNERRNLRLAQLAQLLFMATEKVTGTYKKFNGNNEDLDFLLKCGATALNVYETYSNPTMASVLSLAYDVANLFVMRYQRKKQTEDMDQAQKWLMFAKQMYENRGETDAADKIAQLLANLEDKEENDDNDDDEDKQEK